MAARRIYTWCPGCSEHHNLGLMMARNRGMSSASVAREVRVFWRSPAGSYAEDHLRRPLSAVRTPALWGWWKQRRKPLFINRS